MFRLFFALNNLHRHDEARLAGVEGARALEDVGRLERAAECAALARLSRQFALLHRLPRWLIDHTQTDRPPGARWSRWRRRAHWLLVVANTAFVGSAVTFGLLAQSIVARVAVGAIAAAVLLVEARELVSFVRDASLFDRPDESEQ